MTKCLLYVAPIAFIGLMAAHASAAPAAWSGSMPNPARVIEKCAGQRDAISVALANYRFRLVRVDDQADRLHNNAAGFFHGGSERHLIARRDGRPCRRTDPAGGDADVIEADVAQLAGKNAGLVGRDPAVNPVRAGNAHA